MWPDLAAIVLAAGFSSRMQGFKPLLDLKGQSPLARCVRLFQDAGVPDVVVVCGHEREQVEASARSLGARTVYNPDYASGMFGSVCAGVAALPQECAGFFLLPVDIPLVRRRSVETLLQTWTFRTVDAPDVLMPFFLDQPGHPPLISTALRAQILSAADNAGGLRGVLQQKDVRPVTVPDKGVLLDMDSDQDLERIRRRLARFGLPEREECEALLECLHVPQDVRDHCKAVARAAVAIAQALNARRHAADQLDTQLAERAALLHDLAKGRPRHEEQGGLLLRQWEFDEIADIVAAHRDTALPSNEPLTENETVFMADKLVQGVSCVPLTERYDAVLRRHGHDPEARAAIEGRRERALAVLQRMELEAGRPLPPLVADAL